MSLTMLVLLLFVQAGLGDNYVEGDDFDLETLVGNTWDGDFEEVPLLQRNVDNLDLLDTYMDDEELVGDQEVGSARSDQRLGELNDMETKLNEAVGQPPEVIAKFGYGSNDGPIRPGDKAPATRISVEPPKIIHVPVQSVHEANHHIPAILKKLMDSELKAKEALNSNEMLHEKDEANRQRQKRMKYKNMLSEAQKKLDFLQQKEGLQNRSVMRSVANALQHLEDGIEHQGAAPTKIKVQQDPKLRKLALREAAERKKDRYLGKQRRAQRRNKRRGRRRKRKLRRKKRRRKENDKIFGEEKNAKLAARKRRDRRRRRKERRANRKERRADRRAKRKDRRGKRRDRRADRRAKKTKAAIKKKFAKPSRKKKATKMKLPRAFKKYLKTMDSGKREELMSKLKAANAKDKKKFRALLKQVVKASKDGMKKLEKEESRNAEELRKDLKKEEKDENAEVLKVSQDKDKQIGDIKSKLASLEGDETTNKGKLEYEKKVIKEQGKEFKDKLAAEDKKVQEWERKTENQVEEFEHDSEAKFKSMQDETDRLHKITDDMSAKEKELVMKLNAVRAQRLAKQKPRSRKQRYSCNCSSDQCQSVCDRCNQCTTKRCDDVCSSGSNYKKQLGALKKQISKLKKSWDKRSKANQKALLKLLKKQLKKAKKSYKKKVSVKAAKPVVKIVKQVKKASGAVSKEEKERLRKKAEKAKEKAAKAKLKGKAKVEKQKLKELQLIFQQWLKRSQRRLARLLKKQKVKKSNRGKVVRVFKKYMNRATKTFGKWKSDAKKLAEYLTMTTKVWEEKSKKLLKKVRTKAKKDAKKKSKSKKGAKKKQKKIPKRSRRDMPYGEKLYTEWKETSDAFINNHLAAVMPDKRDSVVEFFNQVVEEARKHYLGYLTKDWKIGTKVKRRRDLLKYFKDASAKLKTHTYIAIFGAGYKKPSTNLKPKTPGGGARRKSRDYIHKMFRKFQKNAKKLANNPKIVCKDKVNKLLRAVMKKGKKERNHAATTTYKNGPGSGERFVKYLVALFKQFRSKLKYFEKTCVQRKGPRPYVTRMYNMFKRKSESFVLKQGNRLCKTGQRKQLRAFWKDMKARAHRKYIDFLNREVADKKAATETEVAVGSWQHNSFTRFLYRQSKALESYVRGLLRKCGFKIITDEKETTVGKSSSSSSKGGDRSDDDTIYGVTLGMNPDSAGDRSIGIGVETMDDKDADYSKWQFDDNANWNKNSYEVGVSLGRRRLLELEDQS